METYIRQLLDDIRAAHRPEEPDVCPFGELCVCKDFEWVKELPDGDKTEEELRERDRLRLRRDEDFGSGAWEADFSV